MNRAQATLEGHKLLKRMKGKGWCLRVWENLGWHYCVANLNGHLSVYAGYNGEQSYSCMLGPDFPYTGSMLWTEHRHFRRPNEAVREEIAEARRVVDRLNEFVKLAEAVIPIKEAKP